MNKDHFCHQIFFPPDSAAFPAPRNHLNRWRSEWQDIRAVDQRWKPIQTVSCHELNLGNIASIKAMDVLKCSITPTTANRFSRLNIASCRADLLLGSPHSMLEDQRRFSKELNDVDLIVYYVYHVCISLDVAALFEFHLSTLCALSLIHI